MEISYFALYCIVVLVVLVLLCRVVYCIGFAHGFNDGANVQHWYNSDRLKWWRILFN